MESNNTNLIRILKDKLIILFFYFIRIIPISKNKIIVSMFNGKGYGAEGKEIVKNLLSDNKNDIVWVCDNGLGLPKSIRSVKFNTIKYLYEIGTAKIWIDNRRKKPYIRKRPGQFYIQTWHGSVCLKKIEKDAEETLSKRYVLSAKNDSKMIDLLVSGSRWRTENYRQAFWYDGKILEGDLYRTNYLLSNENNIKKQIVKEFNLQQDVKIILYAPTFRKDKNTCCYDLDYQRLLEIVKQKFGGNWCIIIRLHPNISYLHKTIKYTRDIIDGSLYPDQYNLLVASDILITDYSGLLFTGFEFKKKVFIYASDYEKYISNEREMYFDLKTLPCPIMFGNNDLEKIIRNFKYEEYENKRNKFTASLGFFYNDASLEICKIIYSVMDGKERK